MTVTLTDLKPFFAELRRLGFRRNFRARDLIIYAREYPEYKAKVDVQLWFEGEHRASNMHESIYLDGSGATVVSPYGRGDSYPSGFKTVRGMARAVEFERTRYLAGVDKGESPHFG